MVLQYVTNKNPLPQKRVPIPAQPRRRILDLSRTAEQTVPHCTRAGNLSPVLSVLTTVLSPRGVCVGRAAAVRGGRCAECGGAG